MRSTSKSSVQFSDNEETLLLYHQKVLLNIRLLTIMAVVQAKFDVGGGGEVKGI